MPRRYGRDRWWGSYRGIFPCGSRRRDGGEYLSEFPRTRQSSTAAKRHNPGHEHQRRQRDADWPTYFVPRFAVPVKNRLAVYLSLGIPILASCANTAQDIKPIPVSATNYRALSCNELSDPANKTLAGLERLGGRVSSPESHENTNIVTGVVLLAPARFFFSKESPEDFEYSRLLGEYQALQENIQERCAKPKGEVGK